MHTRTHTRTLHTLDTSYTSHTLHTHTHMRAHTHTCTKQTNTKYNSMFIPMIHGVTMAIRDIQLMQDTNVHVHVFVFLNIN